MKSEALKSFIRIHNEEVLKKISELQNFGPEDICMFKEQVVRGIRIRSRMKVVNIDEIRELYIGLIAIRVVEKERGYE